jgi:hypothetical protein
MDAKETRRVRIGVLLFQPLLGLGVQSDERDQQPLGVDVQTPGEGRGVVGVRLDVV